MDTTTIPLGVAVVQTRTRAVPPTACDPLSPLSLFERTRSSETVETHSFEYHRLETMTATRATVTCPDCDFEDGFEKLQAARAAIERHRRETGHDPTWELAPFSDGVVQAGEAAGVCGIPGTTDPLTDDES